MANLEVRQASVSDLDELGILFNGYRQFYGQSSDLDRARSFLSERFKYQQSIIIMAHHGSDSIGFAQIFTSFSSVQTAMVLILNDLFVTPESRGLGAGRALLEAAARYGRDIGAARLTLSTGVHNSAAQTLYEQSGWIPDTQFLVYNYSLTA